MIYRRVASPLHAARAGAGGGFCAALAGAALATWHPVVLAALAAAVLGAGAAAGVSADLRRAARLAVPLAVMLALVNVLVSRNGLTVFVRLGEVPPFGQIDLTLEALVYGALTGLRVFVVVMAFALFTAAVDPDEVLRLFGRVSLRSALTAVLATRMVPVLARDARRIEDARRCRPDGGGSGARGRLAVVRAVATGALDRAVDVAATLEVRGYGSGAARAAGRGERWSRHDLAFAAAALAISGLAIGALLAGAGQFDAYPSLRMSLGAADLGLAAGLLAAALLPFADRRGVAR